MTRSELIEALASRYPTLSAEDVTAAAKHILGAMRSALAAGGRIEIRGFGAFAVNVRNARTGRNPKTGEQVTVPAKRTVAFKPGKELRERVNAAAGEATPAGNPPD